MRSAWSRVRSLCTEGRLSRIYETRPLYVENQPPYLNAVGEARSELAPGRMLEELQKIEAAFGRDRSREVRRGARTLDLDILLCDNLVLDLPDLQVPHPLIAERLFVLVPLLELDGDLADPRTGEPFQKLRAALEAAAGSAGGVYLHPGRRYTEPV